MVRENEKNEICFLDVGIGLIKGKWKCIILCHLKSNPIRFLELQRAAKGITQKVLTEQLKALENDGIIERIVYPEIPPKVEYRLTEKGKDLIPALNAIEEWAKKYKK